MTFPHEGEPMRRSEGGHRAHEYEHLTAADMTANGEKWVNRKLYAVEGLPGLWRRSVDPKVSDPVGAGYLPAFFEGGIVYLRPFAQAEQELLEGGYITKPITDETDAAAAQALRDRLAAIDVSARVRPLVPAAPPEGANPGGGGAVTEAAPGPGAGSTDDQSGVTQPPHQSGGSEPPPGDDGATL